VKRHRSAKKEEILELTAAHQKMRQIHDQREKKQKLSKEEPQGSEMRLLSAVFSDDFFQSVATVNDRKLKSELDAGGAGGNKRRWAELTDSHNDSMNNDACGSCAFVEDAHVEEFVTTCDLCKFQQLDWEKACAWFKEIVSDHTKAVKNCASSGVHQPDFVCFVDNKPQICHCRLCILEHPECHEAFNVVLDDTLFSESTTDGKPIKKKAKVTKVPGSIEKKAAILKDVAASMTEAFSRTQAHSAKRNEKSRLEQNAGTVLMNLLSVPKGEEGERARTFFNKQMTENESRVEESKEWFLDNPSPGKK
jgi:hypothetical protein